MPRFRPSVESLDTRTLPSALFVTPNEPVEVVGAARETTPPAKPPIPPTTPPLTDILISSYSTQGRNRLAD